MPYSNPAAPVSVPLPVHSQGRPGHRRSFSYTSTDPSTTTTTSAPNGGAFASLGSLPRRKPASFHLAADDDDDSSVEDNSPPTKDPAPIAGSSRPPPPTTARFAGANLKPTPAGKPANLTTDDEDDQAARGLPPLKLKIPGISGSGGVGGKLAGSPVLSKAGGSANSLPFPRTESPSVSRTPSNLEVHVKSPSPPRTPRGDGTESPRPQIPRTTSGSSIVLANGKPLKSSLKSSSSSPNIPFPSQSLVPSRMYADIAAAQQQKDQEYQRHHHVPPNQRHARAASAPNLPNFDPSSTSTSSPSDTPEYDSLTVPSTPSAPKAVHFPSSEEGGLATIRVFKRTAKPVSLLLPGASGGEETETETDGEGYNSGGANNGVGYHYGINNAWGFGSGYSNPWDRYTRQNAQQRGGGPNGYPFPRMAKPSSPLGQGTKGAPTATLTTAMNATKTGHAATTAGTKSKEKKRIVYELDRDATSVTPKRDLSIFDNVFLETVELKCDKKTPLRPQNNSSSSSPSSSPPSSSSSSEDEDDDDSAAGVSPRLQATLSGSLLVRNLAYEKHVSIRFTLDDWHTTSEVKAAYKESLGCLPERWVKWVCGDRQQHPPKDDNTFAKPPPSNNPQWDRFEFSINLSDYARSRSLSSRTLWLVVRYNVPGDVRIPLPVLLPPSLYTTPPSPSDSPSSSAPGTFDSELLAHCDPEMLTLVVNSLGDPTAAGATRQLVDGELRKRQVGVGRGVGNEWWDNNAHGNYRIGFREREVTSVKPDFGRVIPVEIVDSVGGVGDLAKEGEEEVVKEGQQQGQAAMSAQQRRKNVLSCPPTFTNAPPPPPSISTYSSLSPPQISVSTSVDSGSYEPKAPWVPPSSSTSSTTSPSTGVTSPNANAISGLGGGSLATGVNPSLTARRTETSKAMAETTLERLKRLNLRNYAAPTTSVSLGRTASNPLPLGTPPATTGVTAGQRSNSMLTSTPSSTATGGGGATGGGATTPSETSTNDSTPLTSPLHTPTMGNVDIVVVGEDAPAAGGEGIEDGKLGGGLMRKDDAQPTAPAPASVAIPPPPAATVAEPKEEEKEGSGNSTPTRSAPVEVRPKKDSERDLLSPLLEPFMAGNGGIVELGTSPPFSSLGEVGFGGRTASMVGLVDLASRGPPTVKEADKATTGKGEEEKEKEMKKLEPVVPLPLKPRQIILENIREKSTSSPQRSPVGSGRNSPVPGVVVASPKSTSSGSTPTPGGMVATPKPTNNAALLANAATTIGHATGRKFVLGGGLVESPRGSPRPGASPNGSGSDSNTSSSNKGSGGGGSGSGSSASRSKPGHGHGHGHHRRPPHTRAPATTGSIGRSSQGNAGLGLVLPGNPTAAAMPNSPTSPNNLPNFAAGSRQGSMDDIRDPDSIYQAFVRQWCFASAPSPAQAGGFSGLNERRKAIE